MNKKGFTTIELVLTIVLVVIIMMTITSVTYTYRDRSNYEELITEVTNYKNTLTKIIYDDLLDETNLVTKIEEIFESNDVEKSINVDERLVVVSSTGVFDLKKGSVDYTILRVHFTFINSNNVEDEVFIYFYYEKVNYDRYSLIDVSSSDYVTIK